MLNTDGNIFENLPQAISSDEIVESIFHGENFKLERILSTGQVTPEGEWLDQSTDEWVILLKGHAKLLFENDKEITLTAGDYVFIPANNKHRVSWTDPDNVCVWLALHAQRR